MSAVSTVRSDQALPVEQCISLHLQLEHPAASTESGFRFAVKAELPASGLTAIYGASGSGKTTLLRCIAGLQANARGSLTVNGAVWQSDTFSLPAHERPIGYVFQEANLFPHLSAGDNLRYAQQRASGTDALLSRRDLIAMLGIEHLLSRLPHELSGGERQRVAIARALLVNPQVLLMDEPLASLDAARKREILPYLETLHRELNLPVLYVTHSLEEVARLADHLLVMQDGRVGEQGPVAEVMGSVDSALQQEEGSGAVLFGKVTQRESDWHQVRVEFPGGSLWVGDTGDALGAQLRLRILARDVSLSLVDNTQSSIVNRLPCVVTQIADDQDQSMALIGLTMAATEKTNITRLVARISRRSVADLQLQVGSRVWAQIKSVAILR
jgi:molybdate transport system ATP-binding protein